MKKRFIISSILTMVLIGATIPVSTVEARIVLCGRCGNGSIYTSTKLGNKVAAGEAPCVHGYPCGTDRRWQHTRTRTTSCSYCGVLDVEIDIVYTVGDCHGYY